MISDSDKQMFKTYFKNFLELQDRNEELKEEMKLVRGDVAQLLNVKKPVATKVLTEMKKRHDNGESELDDVMSILEELA